MIRADYPETVIEVLDDAVAYPDGVIEAVQAFAQAGPWQGFVKSRKRKFQRLNCELARACNKPEPTLTFRDLDGGSSGASCYMPREHRIVLTGRLSVVTYLHEFAHSLGLDEREACRWSINLFRRCFPRQYSRLIHVGHTLVRAQEVSVLADPGKVRSTHRSPIYSRSSAESGVIRNRHSGASHRAHHR